MTGIDRTIAAVGAGRSPGPAPPARTGARRASAASVAGGGDAARRAASVFRRKPPPRGRAGQSLIEACLAIFLIGLIFAGLFQISQLFAAREILYHAANRSTRARAVGFNTFMVQKAARVAAIPNAGPMLEPEYENVDVPLQQAVQNMAPGDLWSWVLGVIPFSEQAQIEKARIPYYLGAVNWWQADHTLDYAHWNGLGVSTVEFGDMIDATVSQEYPLTAPLHRTFYAGDTIDLAGASHIENHYPLYLEPGPGYW